MECRCNRCGTTWIKKKRGMPKQCAKCKSPYWRTDYTRKRKKMVEA